MNKDKFLEWAHKKPYSLRRWEDLQEAAVVARG